MTLVFKNLPAAMLIVVFSASVAAQPAPAPAEPPPGAGAPPATETPPATGTPNKAFFLVLNEGKRLASQGRYYDATLLFNKILSEGDETQDYYQEAQYELGVALFELKLFVSSFGYFDRVVEVGPQHLRYTLSLPWLTRIHRQLPGETNTLARMAGYPVETYPPDLADEINFYVGQHHYYASKLAPALASLSRVTTSHPDLYAKAMYLKGVVHVRLNQAGPASETFKEVLRYLIEHDIGADRQRYTEMTRLSLARIFYSTAQYDTAIRYFDQIPDNSDNWLESLFERAWAYFQSGNYARALGNIQTVSSPYFEEEYYPEALMLRAVIFFKNCRYEEALATVDPFYQEYYEIMKELDAALTAHPDPSDFYQYLAAASVKGASYSKKVKKIFNAALADKKLRRLFEFVLLISQEIQQVEQLRKHPVAKGMAEFLLPDLVAYRSLTMSEAGRLARERLARVNKELKSLLSQALKVRFESLNAQKGVLEEKFRKEQVSESKGAQVVDFDDMSIDSEHVLWPFDGEFWKDELGSYYYPLKSLCGKAK
jgi:tetratricopeptide (TPR) repeat protein